jgi:acetyltransferase-like isoleucine patch superfamily enzyme
VVLLRPQIIYFINILNYRIPENIMNSKLAELIIKYKMNIFLRNPLTKWLTWHYKTKKLMSANKHKFLKIMDMAILINVNFGKYNTFYENSLCVNTKIDDFVYIGPHTQVKYASIGKFCSIGPHVKIGLGMHPTKFTSTFPAFFSIRKQCQITFRDKNYFEELGNVDIGNDVWIGANALVIDGISIGDGAIVAAGAMVTKNVPPYAIVGGVPAKIIKYRFERNIIDELLASKWWDKDINWLQKMAKKMDSPEEFLATIRAEINQDKIHHE